MGSTPGSDHRPTRRNLKRGTLETTLASHRQRELQAVFIVGSDRRSRNATNHDDPQQHATPHRPVLRSLSSVWCADCVDLSVWSSDHPIALTKCMAVMAEPSFVAVPLKLGLKRIQILTNPSPNRVIETNTGYPRIPPDIKFCVEISLTAGCY